MADDRRMITDRFYGGVSNRLQNLRSMLEYVHSENPSRSQLNQWVISNTRAGSEEAVSHHLTFLESIELIELSEKGCKLAEYGERWLDDQSSETLYEALSSGVKGFDTLLQALREGAVTDGEIMELLVREFEEAEMTKPGPAIRHREWLQVLGYIERDGEVNRLTSKGRDLVETKHGEETNAQPVSPDDVSVGNKLSQEEIETAFDTGFGYRISGINPRRDEHDRRYILLFANEEGPYKDAVTQGRFEYIGEGLEGDQSEDSPGNSALIDAHSSDIPIHFFYQRMEDEDWEYQGLVDIVDYEFQKQNGREVLVYTLEHRQQSEEPEPSEEEIEEERTQLQQATESEPQLTTDDEQYTKSRRRARDAAFTQLVIDAYDRCCAICGSKRKSPAGNPEVEAAHIYPKRKGGSDDVRNGIALCKLHHWAFDVGWLSLSDEHEILVKEAPNKNGYHEFKRLEGDCIHLPDEEAAEPQPMFIKEHRKLYGFGND
jgi:putative restriction endonuclease